MPTAHSRQFRVARSKDLGVQGTIQHAGVNQIPSLPESTAVRVGKPIRFVISAIIALGYDAEIT